MRGREELGRLSEFEISAVSTRADIGPRRSPGQERHGEGGAAERGRVPLLQRLRHALRPGGHGRALLRVPHDRGVLALVPDPHRRLPHLPGEDGSRDRQGGLRRSLRCGVRGWTHRHVWPARVLRAVPRDRLRLREPPDGGRGHLLTTSTTGRPARAEAGRLLLRPQGAGERGEHRVLPAAPGDPLATRSSSTPGRAPRASSRASSPGRLRLHEAQGGPGGEGASSSSRTSARTTRSSTTPASTSRRGRRALRAGAHRRAPRRVRAGRGRVQRARDRRRPAVQAHQCSAPRPGARVPDRRRRVRPAGQRLRDRARRRPSTYHCTFTVLQSRQQFRPARVTPRPIVQGPQTAVVVGPGGEEI